jgi:hypothetical protein
MERERVWWMSVGRAGRLAALRGEELRMGADEEEDRVQLGPSSALIELEFWGGSRYEFTERFG